MPSEDHHHDLSAEERARVTMQVEYFVHLIERRYGMSANDVVEAVRYVGRVRERNSKFAQAGAVSIIGMVATAFVLSLCEGVKSWVKR